jgi:hypothetical protein
MAEILATKTSLAGCEGAGTFEAARAGALFASTLQPSGSPSPGQIRRAVTTTLQRLGVRGAKNDLREQLGPEFADLQIEDLNPKRLVRKHLSADLNADQGARQQPARQRVAATAGSDRGETNTSSDPPGDPATTYRG